MISLAENCDEGGLEWVTNYDAGRLDDWSHAKWLIQGEPRGTGAYSSLELKRMGMIGLYRVKPGFSVAIAFDSHSGQAEPSDPYASAKAAFADGELQYRTLWNGNWVDWLVSWSPAYDLKPSNYRRRPKPDEPTTEPSVLQEHANLIAKLDEAEGDAKWLTDIWPNVMDTDGWWGDFGYTPASDRNGIANEAMRQAMTQKPAAPEPKPQAPDGVFEVAPMGRNPRGWGL